MIKAKRRRTVQHGIDEHKGKMYDIQYVKGNANVKQMSFVSVYELVPINNTIQALTCSNLNCTLVGITRKDWFLKLLGIFAKIEGQL